MEKSNVTSSHKQELSVFFVRLGKIFSNLSIFFFIICCCGFLSFIATAFIFVIGFCLIVFTFGLIFAIMPNFWDIFITSSSISAKISGFFLQHYYLLAFVVLFSILAIIFLKFDRHNKHIARIVFSSIVLAIAVLVIIVIAVGVIK